MRAIWGSFIVGNLLLANPAAGLGSPASITMLPNHRPPSMQPDIWQSTLDTNALLNTSRPLSVGIEISTDHNGEQQITSYPQLNFSLENSISLSFERYNPKIKFNAGGMDTAIKLRGNGVKLEFNPTDRTIPLQVEIKVTSDESEILFDYQF